MRQESLVREITSKNRPSNVMLCLVAVFDMVPIVVVIHLVGSSIAGKLSDRAIVLSAALMLGCFACKALCSYGATWKAHKAAYTCLAELRMRIIGRLRELSLGFFQTRKTGDLANIMQNDVEQVEVYLAHGLPEIMSATLLPAVIFVLMVVVDWRLALVMVAGLPFMWLVKRLAAPRWAKGFATLATYTTNMQESLVEYVANIPVIKAFSKEETKTSKTIGASRDYVLWVTKSMNTVAVPMGLIAVFMEVGVVLVIVLGTWLLSVGEIGIAQLILAMVLASVFTSSVAKIATLQHYGIMFNQAMAGVESIVEAPGPKRSQGTELTRAGDVVLRDVTFSYPRAESNENAASRRGAEIRGRGKALDAINLSFPLNSRSALVGSSGCGKTTLASILMGFWQPERGSVEVGGQNLSDLSEAQIGSLFSIVQQDVFLFNVSMEENIRIGKPGATRDEVIAAAKKARIHEFIEDLPNGYATCAGEAGVKFSGGEKQRVSIARMILKDAPVIILDEATAAVDAENEALIQAAIDDMSRNKTVIAIAHHLKTVRDFDQIVVMDEGRVVDSGIHTQLMDRCPLYRAMVEDQARVDNWNIKEW